MNRKEKREKKEKINVLNDLVSIIRQYFQEEKINVIRYTDKQTETEYVYITDLPIRKQNIKETIEVGKRRWKIENEGFNIQKNGTFDIGHLYSKNQTAIKVHYLMIQIAHIIR